MIKKTSLKDQLKNQAEFLIQNSGLRRTELRLQILEIFLNSSSALTQGQLIEILEKQNSTIDRVSIYRNLNQLKSTGLVHEVENNFYVLCSHECAQHAHVLLYCQNCHRHSEIKDHGKIKTMFEALGGFQFFGEMAPVFIKGRCLQCSK